MRAYHKVLWTEGTFLGPQHFQQQDRYHEQQRALSSSLATAFPWGVSAVELDTASLVIGALQVEKLRIIFPDGEVYDAPYCDRIPEARNLNQLVPATTTEITVYAGLPSFDPFSGNCDLGAGGRARPARYYREFIELQDLYGGTSQSQVAVARRNVRLLLEHEIDDDMQVIPIARLRRNHVGHFEVVRDYIPPIIEAGASPYLITLIKRLVEICAAKSLALSGKRRERSQNVVEFGAADVSAFWLLHTVNQVFPMLRHVHQYPQIHPERLYLILAGLLTSLRTFGMDAEITDTPPYAHLEQTAVFEALDQDIRVLLDTVIPSRCITIPLTTDREHYHTGRIDNEMLVDGRADFYLAVHADMSGVELVEAVPRLFKLGSPDRLESIVNYALPGVRLSHAQRVPSAIPMRLDNQYFGLMPEGEAYDTMLRSRTISIYTPSLFKGLQLELMAVLNA